MATLVLDRVSKRYVASWAAVDEVSLEIGDGEFMVLVGPSGCGKSTTLRLIAGLEDCDGGEIRLDGRRVNERAARDRNLAMVFQNYALYPHLSVYKNMAFGLELRYGGGLGARILRRIFRPRRAAELARQRRGISQRVQQTASRLGIQQMLDRRPHQLSGGERQRVALGRAIVRNPAAFLFDEPLSNLDAKLRMEMRGELKRLHRELGTTVVYVTHDQIEAMTLGDRIAVMNRGRVVQVGSPADVYRRPCDRWVAEFIGSQAMNFLPGRVGSTASGSRFVADEGGWSWPVERGAPPRSGPLVLGVRPEHVRLRRAVRDADGGGAGAAGRVRGLEWFGESAAAQVAPRAEGAAANLVARLPGAAEVAVGDDVEVELEAAHVMWFDGASGRNLGKA